MSITGEARTYALELITPEDPTDPAQNPEYGAPTAPEGDKPYTPSIIGTAYTATVLSVLKGDLSVGDVVETKQLGGHSDESTFVAEGESSLAKTAVALVFLSQAGLDP